MKMILSLVAAFILIASNLNSQNSTLTNDQRRVFLRYYSPVILKRAEEGIFNGVSQRGRDWLTNWYFDNQTIQNSYDKRAWQNHLLRDNRGNWRDYLNTYINNSGTGFPNWAIRPTLYTALLEFMENDINGVPKKCLILMYHPYQAMDLDNKIHDWESITLRLDGVTGNPGSGEEISYVVITVHGDDAVLKYGEPSLNFEINPDGKHVLIWRAQWDFHPASDDREGQELQFVRDKTPLYGSDMVSAAVSIFDPIHRPSPVTANFHYIFVCEGTQSSSQRWNAQAINNCNVLTLSSGKNPNDVVTLRDTKKISYELQDIADIIPTMKYDYDWKDASAYGQQYYHMGDCIDPILSEDSSVVEVVANNGEQTYFPEARGDDRRGYVTKDWFSGKFGMDWNDNKTQHRYKPMKKLSWTTQAVSPLEDFYFSNNAQLNNKYDMATDWYLTSKGGFDGRYVQLFNDRDLRQYSPLSASFEGPSSINKGNTATWISYVSGGNCGYIYEWKNNSTVVGTGSSVAITVNYNFTLTLTVRSATGESSVLNEYITAITPGGCPFVFAGTDHGMELDNNILHRSEFKENKNRDIRDLYKMSIAPTKIDNAYRLQIKELNSDHSYFDHFSLYAVDLSSGTDVGVTEDSRIVRYSYTDMERADEIVFGDGEIISGGNEDVEGAKNEIMHVKFSQEKINRLHSALAKTAFSGGAELALRIDFRTFYPTLPPKEQAFYLGTEDQVLSKSKASAMQFARREMNAPVFIPISSDMPLDDIVIHWNRDFAFSKISLVPVYEISSEKQTLQLKSAVHSHEGNVTSKLTKKDQKYAELDSTETIDLVFQGLNDPADGFTRSFVLETNGRYIIPGDGVSGSPKEFSLIQNYPNPFNPSTTIRYNLTENTKVTLKIYNTLGQEVRTLVDKVETSGIKDVMWDGRDSFGKQVASGVYIYKLNAGKIATARKMIFVK